MRSVRIEIQRSEVTLLSEEERMEIARDLARLIVGLLHAETEGERRLPAKGGETEAA